MHPSYYYQYTYRRYRPRRGIKLITGLFLLVVLVFIAAHLLSALVPALAQGEHWLLDALFLWSDRDPRGIIRVGVPLIAWSGDGEHVTQLVSPRDLITPIARAFGVGRREPLQILELQLPLLAAASARPEETAPVLAPETVPQLDEELQTPVPPISEEALVAIYNTHTGETYALTDGMERLNGKRGGVVKAAAALERELVEKYGIRVARSDDINDANYSTSYARSQETLRQLLEDNPSVQVVLDIHRDAGKSRENSLVVVEGRRVAPVLIIVGSDARALFPTWRQNYEFARELAAEIEKQHPGLCLGVRIKEGRYNQFLHPRAVLLEIGSVSNSTEEAVQSARLLAGPVAEMVKRSLDAD